jgi:helicase
MSSEKAIRFHLLSSISTNPGMKLAEIVELFSLTLFAVQNRPAALEFKIRAAAEYLEKEGLVELKRNRYIATGFGRRTSLLYVDPMTDVDFRRALERVDRSASIHTLGLLQLLTDNSDFFPRIALRRKDYDGVALLLDTRRPELLVPMTEYDVSRSFWALAEWLEEMSYKRLGEGIGVEPGDIHRIIESAGWLAYSLYEIAKSIHRDDVLNEIFCLRTRIRYGIKEELLELVAIEGIGRARARALFNAGFTDIAKIANAPTSMLASVQKIGPALAERIKDQLKKKANQ